MNQYQCMVMPSINNQAKLLDWNSILVHPLEIKWKDQMFFSTHAKLPLKMNEVKNKEGIDDKEHDERNDFFSFKQNF